MNPTIHNIVRTLAVMLALMAMAACSTTRRLGEDETLYTGVKKIEINAAQGQEVDEATEEAIKTALSIAPNNPLFSPYVRHPFPVGLWVYNNWDNPPSGLKHWLYEKLVSEPVLIEDVRPELRTKMIEELLGENGYFRGSADYELLYSKRNKKKVRISYTINAGPAYRLDSIYMLPDTCHLFHKIDSVAAKSNYLKRGERYCVDSLNAERTRIANAVRNYGYYYFRPEYIEYLADSTVGPQRIALKMEIAASTPAEALRRYRTGNVTIRINRNEGGGTPDTFQTQRGTVIQMMPSRLRREVIAECVTFREGRTFSVRNMNSTQTYLSRLGIFNAINMSVTPDSTSTDSDLLDVAIDCTFDAPLEASIEANVASKSNSYLGPGLTLGLTNRNLFGGGEQLNINLTGAYEWATGGNSGENSSVFNSYEIGLSAALTFPRLLAPNFIPRTRRYVNSTRITLDADLLNRPHYFKMAEFSTSFNYDWRPTRHSTSTLTLFKLAYTKVLHTTATFDSIMDANPAVALSFRNQFIPQIGYSYTWDRSLDRDNHLNWQFSAIEAGNIFWSIWELTGSEGEKRLLGTPFSQFVKGTAQLVYSHRLFGSHWLVTRAGVGAAHAYGNSSQVPYSEQFYIGGANSVRAFTVRSVGPGSYRAEDAGENGYFDQTGTFKFEFNIEYRFPIYGMFRGALFLDAGNVWLLKDDPLRPGSNLKASTFFKDLALGTGLGLRFDMGMLVVRGDLGIGLHLPYDTGKSGYYNMPSFKDSLAFHLAIGYPF